MSEHLLAITLVPVGFCSNLGLRWMGAGRAVKVQDTDHRIRSDPHPYHHRNKSLRFNHLVALLRHSLQQAAARGRGQYV